MGDHCVLGNTETRLGSFQAEMIAQKEPQMEVTAL